MQLKEHLTRNTLETNVSEHQTWLMKYLLSKYKNKPINITAEFCN